MHGTTVYPHLVLCAPHPFVSADNIRLQQRLKRALTAEALQRDENDELTRKLVVLSPEEVMMLVVMLPVVPSVVAAYLLLPNTKVPLCA